MAVMAVFRRRRKREQRGRRGMYLLPSMFTMANLFCGYACLIYTLRGDFQTAAPFLGIALVLDTLDGRIARLTGASSAFGLEFDSLADIVSFGVAPAVLTSAWGLTAFGRLGWAAGAPAGAGPNLASLRPSLTRAKVCSRRSVISPLRGQPWSASKARTAVFVRPPGLPSAEPGP